MERRLRRQQQLDEAHNSNHTPCSIDQFFVAYRKEEMSLAILQRSDGDLTLVAVTEDATALAK